MMTEARAAPDGTHETILEAKSKSSCSERRSRHTLCYADRIYLVHRGTSESLSLRTQ